MLLLEDQVEVAKDAGAPDAHFPHADDARASLKYVASGLQQQAPPPDSWDAQAAEGPGKFEGSADVLQTTTTTTLLPPDPQNHAAGTGSEHHSAPACPKFVTPEAFKAWVNMGRAMIVFEGMVYDLSKWVKHHPGGELAIRHMVGRDCTDEIKAQHPEWVIRTKMPCFCVGRLLHPGRCLIAADQRLYDGESSWPVTSPPSPSPGPVDAASAPLKTIPGLEALFKPADQAKISAAWRLLDLKLRDEGMYETDYKYYYVIAARLVFFFGAAWGLVLFGPANVYVHLLSAYFLASLWHQGAFVAHDAGHNGITHNRAIDSKIGMFLGNCLGGISIGWWKKSHNVHHIVTNHPEHDPDIQHLPFFAVTTAYFQSLYSTYHKRVMKFDRVAKFFVSFQHYLYFPLHLVARPNLYIQSILFLLNDQEVAYRKAEIAGLIFFWAWYTTLLSYLPSTSSIVVYVATSHIMTGILHLQISLSHFGMSTADGGPGESFAARMLRTTMDIDCPEWFDWFHGGLQFQAIHHLFPRLPRHNLRRARPLVVKFCEDMGLTYHVHTFTKGNGMVLSSMRQVAQQVDFIVLSGAPRKEGVACDDQ